MNLINVSLHSCIEFIFRRSWILAHQTLAHRTLAHRTLDAEYEETDVFEAGCYMGARHPWAMRTELESQMERTEMRMIRWVCDKCFSGRTSQNHTDEKAWRQLGTYIYNEKVKTGVAWIRGMQG